jgi:hypothetical protein
MRHHRLVRDTVLATAVVALSACGQPATTPAPAKQVVSKRNAPDFAARPAIDRASKKIADNKPGDGRVAVLRTKAAAPTPITAGRAINGTLSRSDDRVEDGSFVDYYVYAGSRGERLTITMRSRAFDAYLMIGSIRRGVFDPDETDDDSGGNTDAQIEITLGATGNYVIAANAISARDTGPYVLEVVRSGASIGDGVGGSGGAAAGDVGSLELNTPANGRLQAGDRVMQDKSYYDYWVFEGRGGQRVTITMRSDSFDAFLILRRGAPGRGAVIAEDDDGGGGSHAQIVATLPDSGTYTVVANSYAPATGPYTLVVEAGRPGPAPPPGPTPGPRPGPSVPYEDLYPGTGDPNDKYALVVGIDDYPGTDDDLEGSVEDSRIFSQLLIRRFGFKPNNVVVLNNSVATRDHILNAFTRHLGQAGPQGAAVFYYSGHGVQMDNNLALTAPLDPERDGRDEAIVAWGTDDRSSIILDDEIGFLIGQLKTDRVLIVHDSCNSGTSARGVTPQIKPREVPFARLQGTMLMPRDFAVSAPQAPGQGRLDTLAEVLESRRPYVLLAGSRDDELSNAVTGLPGKSGFAGAFTFYLTAALEAATEQTTFTDMMTRVTAQTSGFIRKNFNEAQTPQLSGSLVRRPVLSVLR